MTRTRALAVGLVVAALAVPVAGCGDDADEATPGTTTTETTPETTTGATTETTDAGGAPPVGGILAGTVGPGFDISVETNGTIPAGSYELAVEDLSSAHNFHLTGPGVDVTTSVSGEGTESFTVELVPGTYEFVCDPHASSMNGSLAVEG
jgi:Copper binding proteins, plastocyanin/azurin family